VTELQEALAVQERAWNERPLLRRLYRGWYRELARRLADVAGANVELGSGIGKLREAIPGIVTTDVEPTQWSDRIVDAAELPWEDGSLANLVLVDVFHHLSRPAAFLDEAARTLTPGGRVLILDPYCSPLSTLAYTRLHHERTDLSAAPFAEDERIAAAPLESNQACATLAFFRAADEYARRWPALRVVERRRLAVLAYPLSGGFTKRSLVPSALTSALVAVDRALEPILAPLAAFRCLIVLERR
jgi:SAM-dependent methyltransferase